MAEGLGVESRQEELFLACYPVGTGAQSPVVQWPDRVADHSLPSSVEIKNAWRYISMPSYVLMASCLSIRLSACFIFGTAG
jgi:hypothetical protein